MARGKGKRGTPPELDEFFSRDVISEEDYRDFWPRWWRGSKQERQRIIEELSQKAERENAKAPTEALPVHRGKAGKQIAERESKHIGQGWRVVRRNASGWFSRNGSYFQAVPPSTKKSRK